MISGDVVISTFCRHLESQFTFLKEGSPDLLVAICIRPYKDAMSTTRIQVQLGF